MNFSRHQLVFLQPRKKTRRICRTQAMSENYFSVMRQHQRRCHGLCLYLPQLLPQALRAARVRRCQVASQQPGNRRPRGLWSVAELCNAELRNGAENKAVQRICDMWKTPAGLDKYSHAPESCVTGKPPVAGALYIAAGTAEAAARSPRRRVATPADAMVSAQFGQIAAGQGRAACRKTLHKWLTKLL